jgi:hypothetical protein
VVTTSTSDVIYSAKIDSKFKFNGAYSIASNKMEKDQIKEIIVTDVGHAFLPEDYIPLVRQTLANLHGDLKVHAERVLESGWVQPNKRIFNNAKISDHFAIIPTLQAPKSLSEPEQKLYDLVVRRFMAVFFPSAQYQVTTRITKVQAHHFKTEGKVLVKPGWLAIGPVWPKPESRTMTSPGLIFDSESQPRPSFSMTPGRKFSTTMSASATRRLTMATPSGCLRLTVIDFLLRAWTNHHSEVSPSSVG